MNEFVHFPRPRVLSRVRVSAQSSTSKAATGVHAVTAVHTFASTQSPIERQAAIENALSMALYFIRQPGDVAANVWAATARTNRALTLLKQASQGNAPASPANALGRA